MKKIVYTSNIPRQRPNVPTTPASSSTSRAAVQCGSSFGSTPPPGTIQLSGRRDDVTNKTCKEQDQDRIEKFEKVWVYGNIHINFVQKTLTSSSSMDRTQMQAALCRNPSLSYIRVEFGFSFTILFVFFFENSK